MKRVFKLNKSGNNTYICMGGGCDRCCMRFKCFSVSKYEYFVVDWHLIHTNESPTKYLERQTHSRVYVKGSKRYNKALLDMGISPLLFTTY